MFTSKEPITLLEAASVAGAVFMIGIASLFPSNVRPLVPALNSYWLHLHVTLAFLGEACFAIAFVLSYLYCLKRLFDRSADDTKPACRTKKNCLPRSRLGFSCFIFFGNGRTGLLLGFETRLCRRSL
jgi:hypothetical protein